MLFQIIAIIRQTILNQITKLREKTGGLTPRSFLRREMWRLILKWIWWRISIKRRPIVGRIKRLIVLEKNATPEMIRLRNEVFGLICLELKHDDQEKLLTILNSVNGPSGPEQIFFAAIFPQILKRNFGFAPIPTRKPHELQIEIGYLAHAEDYFFWFFEIDGKRKDDPSRTFVPNQKIRGDKRYLIYRLGVAALVDRSDQLRKFDPMSWIINSRTHFNNVMADLKNRNYQVTAVTIPHFETGRLSLLRRLALDELKKRQAQIARRNRR